MAPVITHAMAPFNQGLGVDGGPAVLDPDPFHSKPIIRHKEPKVAKHYICCQDEGFLDQLEGLGKHRTVPSSDDITLITCAPSLNHGVFPIGLQPIHGEYLQCWRGEYDLVPGLVDDYIWLYPGYKNWSIISCVKRNGTLWPHETGEEVPVSGQISELGDHKDEFAAQAGGAADENGSAAGRHSHEHSTKEHRDLSHSLVARQDIPEGAHPPDTEGELVNSFDKNGWPKFWHGI